MPLPRKHVPNQLLMASVSPLTVPSCFLSCDVLICYAISLDFDFAITPAHWTGVLLFDFTCSPTRVAPDLLFYAPIICDFYLTSTGAIAACLLLLFYVCTLAIWTCNLLSHNIHPFPSLAKQGSCCLDKPFCASTNPIYTAILKP